MIEFKTKMLALINQYIKEEESLGDYVRFAINPTTHEMAIEADPDVDDPEMDYYEMPDLLQMSADGSWSPDPEAVDEIVEEYKTPS